MSVYRGHLETELGERVYAEYDTVTGRMRVEVSGFPSEVPGVPGNREYPFARRMCRAWWSYINKKPLRDCDKDCQYKAYCQVEYLSCKTCLAKWEVEKNEQDR